MIMFIFGICGHQLTCFPPNLYLGQLTLRSTYVSTAHSQLLAWNVSSLQETNYLHFLMEPFLS